MTAFLARVSRLEGLMAGIRWLGISRDTNRSSKPGGKNSLRVAKNSI